MAHDNSVYYNTSWGRTRRPKNVNGAQSTTHITSETAYATENQRFLHVTVSAAQNKSVKIYLYDYAVQVWAPLMVNDGDGTFSQASASTVNNGTAANQPQHFIFEIAGADRVAFVSSDAPTVHACYTTF